MPEDIVEIVEYDPQWPDRFARERDLLQSSLGKSLRRIEPIGGTAVPGSAGKPTLDIMVGVEGLPPGKNEISELEGLGYRYLGEYGVPGRHFFRKGLPPTHHVHWVVLDGDFWNKQILFRDYLRAHPDALARYVDLKRSLAERFSKDRAKYTEAKGEFIESILIQAGEWRSEN